MIFLHGTMHSSSWDQLVHVNTWTNVLIENWDFRVPESIKKFHPETWMLNFQHGEVDGH